MGGSKDDANFIARHTLVNSTCIFVWCCARPHAYRCLHCAASGAGCTLAGAELAALTRMILSAVLAAMAPLLSYGYVYWRGALHPEWWGAGNWSTDQAWFWAFLSTAQGREELSRGFAPGSRLLGRGLS